MTLQATIAKMLTKRESLTSAQCTSEIEKIGKRLEVIRARSKEISSSPTGRGDLGPERQRIAETGSPSDLIKLNQEEELLDAEDSSLCYQRDALRKRQKKAVIEEAPGLAKAAIKKLPAALKVAEAAKVEHDQATAKLESIQTDISQARQIALHDGQEHAGLAPTGVTCPSVKLKLFERLAYALDWYWFLEYKPLQVENGSHALHRRRMALTDYQPELKPIFPDISDYALLRRASEERKKRYLDQSSVPEVDGE